MLLNVSNHPYSGWPTPQQEQAIMRFEEVADLPFPAINPYLSSNDLDTLVDDYAQRVLTLNPAAVHIMGEMTFTYRLVNMLKAKRVLCLASTTERIATVENGVKTSQFKFVQFRNY